MIELIGFLGYIGLLLIVNEVEKNSVHLILLNMKILRNDMQEEEV
jgi:hypothetical protein